MSRCEACEGRAEKTCGYDDNPMLSFCTEDYIEHIESAHRDNDTAQAEAISLRLLLKTAEKDLLKMIGKL